MDDKLRNFYLESQVKNATAGQLLVMLYDELIVQAESAESEISAMAPNGNLSVAAKAISRSINILTELNTCLNHSVDPNLCARLSDLYLFFTQQLSEALSLRQPGRVRDILPLIRRLRGTWCEADRRANKFQPDSVAVAAY
jgi:flagellar biosynthetic protein FliS